MSRIVSGLVVPAFLMLTSVSLAHFPWLIKDKDGKAVHESGSLPNHNLFPIGIV